MLGAGADPHDAGWAWRHFEQFPPGHLEVGEGKRGREKTRKAHNATHLGAQLRQTNASRHREGISGYSHLIPPWDL